MFCRRNILPWNQMWVLTLKKVASNPQKKVGTEHQIKLKKGTVAAVSMRGKQAKNCTLLGFRAEEGSIMIPSELP